ncbi:rCG37837 [Rattus norvegicus]|uniref:RCG37837 n=1 Tax=Rattus norvegicus TaxID=10116 RepID=A6K660_RAT|nr:rCG37837 [Rattus norvegicus]
MRWSREARHPLGCWRQCKHFRLWHSCFLRICPALAGGAASESLLSIQCSERRVEL